jgi:hypothetical protein
MRRRLFTLMSFLSLLLCAAAVALWVRSYWGTDYVELSSPAGSDSFSITHHTHGVRWTRGDIRLSHAEQTLYMHKTPSPKLDGTGRSTWGWGRLGAGHMGSEPLPADSVWSRLGFHSYRRGEMSSFYDIREQGVALPAWLPVVIFGVAPALWLARRVRTHRRIAKGFCRNCGYDLCATPGRCPECGTEALPADSVNLARSL